jgi:hypothetical protein
MITFRVPSGIGDISWCYSKLTRFTKPFRFEVCGEGPARGMDFVNLLPLVSPSAFADFSYSVEFVQNGNGLPSTVNFDDLEDGTHYLSLNSWLERGNHISDFAPTFPTSYHYHLIREPYPLTNKKRIAVYCSKYEHYSNENWRFWEVSDWVKFLSEVQKMFPVEFVFLGAEYDTGLGKEVCSIMNGVDMVGKANISKTVGIMASSDYVFSYPSGIGVLGDVLNKPTMMFMPRHLTLMCTHFADPKNVESGKFINVVFPTVETALELFTQKGLPHVA